MSSFPLTTMQLSRQLPRPIPNPFTPETRPSLLRPFFPSVNMHMEQGIAISSTPAHRSHGLPPTDRVPNIPEFSLLNKVILVTGAARGLGLTQAEALLEAGAIVYALDRLPEPSEEFHRVQKRAKGTLNSRFEYRQIDVRNVVGLNIVVDEIAASEGHIDGLIAAAGIQQETPAMEYTPKDMNMMFEINITGVFMTAQAVARYMIPAGNGGSIVLIGSMSGTVANRNVVSPAYNVSKAGILQLARNLASEWGGHKIRVNTISPGYTLTSMVTDLFQIHPEKDVEWSNQNMLGRLSKPEEYRGAAVFLLSDASSYMTGSDLRIDGGHCSW